MNRRNLLAFSPVALLILTRCGPAGSRTPAQYAADARGIIAALLPLIPALAAVAPAIMTPARVASAMAAIELAQQALGTLSDNLSTVEGATVLARVEGMLNAVLATISFVTPAAAEAIPGLAPFVGTIQAIVVLVHVLEVFLNTALARPAAVTASLRARTLAPVLTPDTARARLGVAIAR